MGAQVLAIQMTWREQLRASVVSKRRRDREPLQARGQANQDWRNASSPDFRA